MSANQTHDLKKHCLCSFCRINSWGLSDLYIIFKENIPTPYINIYRLHDVHLFSRRLPKRFLRKKFDGKSAYSGEHITRTLQQWGPLHESQLCNGTDKATKAQGLRKWLHNQHQHFFMSKLHCSMIRVRPLTGQGRIQGTEAVWLDGVFTCF